MRKGVGSSKHKHSVVCKRLRGSKSHSSEGTWFPAAVLVDPEYSENALAFQEEPSHLMNQKFNSMDNKLMVIEDFGCPRSSIRHLALMCPPPRCLPEVTLDSSKHSPQAD